MLTLHGIMYIQYEIPKALIAYQRKHLASNLLKFYQQSGKKYAGIMKTKFIIWIQILLA